MEYFRKLTVLVIEDNMGDFILINEYLEEQITELTIKHAKNFSTAKQILEDKNNNFDIVLLDLSLPDKKGEELISEILLISSGIPVIVLTGYSDIEFGIKSMALGVSDYLLKDDITSVSLYKHIIYTIERKRKELELEESEKRYSDLFHLSPQPMWVYDSESLQFQDVNAAAIEHYGYSKSEFLAMTTSDILHKECEQYNLCISQELIEGSCRHKKKNGEIIQVELKRRNITFKGKESQIVVINDVTKIRDYIHTIEIQNSKLQEIAWMQSHVVRAPLARMMGIVNSIKDESLSELERQEFFTYFLDSAHELDKIIRDISEKTNEVKIIPE
ncbi:putative PAS/PAC sensor protein [Emticicia oligotrophica DSM 17448]|uniref:PAS/PAC sensor protein n=1 Tax=Emticicia oligotrophica (strain DSM 17448 / CIP 109782 / MTCC 6937 / GPTSA100-15) TaxID=929562 RepID=A0ABM5N787_EMTOG|nr:response regulator [Emticicia oligotrophica]AFK05402.1 putative PAS/PAC sensor protein [Emticicia oligotrophica DSM 17448]